MAKQIKIISLFFLLFAACVLLHNAIYALFRIEEPVFFVLALVFFVAFIVSLVYNVMSWIRQAKKAKK